MMNATTGPTPSTAPPAYAESGHTTTHAGGVVTHTTTSTRNVRAQLELRKDYVTTLPGILKLVEVASSLICIICASAGGDGSAGWGSVASVWIFISSLLWFFLNLFNLVSKIRPVRVLIEWIYYLVLSIFLAILVIVAIVAAVKFPTVWAFVSFGSICTVAISIDLYLQFKVWRAEGHIVTTHATTTASTEGDQTTLVTDVEYNQPPQLQPTNK